MSSNQSNLCRLCVKICHECKNLYDANDHGNDLYNMIVNYFQPALLDMDKCRHLKAICLECWFHLWNFQNFQKSVLEAQTNLLEDNMVVIKQEMISIDDAVDDITRADESSTIETNSCVKDPLKHDSDKLITSYVNELSTSSVPNDNHYINKEVSTTVLAVQNVVVQQHLIHMPKLELIDEADQQSILTPCVNELLNGPSTRKDTVMTVENVVDQPNSNNIPKLEYIDEAYNQSLLLTRHSNKPTNGPSTSRIQNAKEDCVPISATGIISEFNQSAAGVIYTDSYENDSVLSTRVDAVSKDVPLSANQFSPNSNDGLKPQNKSLPEISEDNDLSEDALDNPLAQWLPILKCEQCSMTYASLNALKAHFRDNHAHETFYIICCNRKLYRPYQIEDHVHLHNNSKAFICNSCNKSYVSRNSLKRHMKSEHAVNSGFKKFRKNLFIRKSQSQTSQKANEITENRKSQVVYDNSYDKSKEMENDDYEVSFGPSTSDKNQKFSKETFEDKQKYANIYRDDSFDHSTSLEHKTNEKNSIMNFDVNDDLTDNEHDFDENDSMPATGIDYDLPKYNDMTNINLSNPLAKWLPVLNCVICFLTYTNLALLRNHFRECHRREKFYIVCCNRKLSRPFQIKDHVNFHNNSNAFSCNSCNITYTSRQSLKRHLKLEHKTLNSNLRSQIGSTDEISQITETATQSQMQNVDDLKMSAVVKSELDDYYDDPVGPSTSRILKVDEQFVSASETVAVNPIFNTNSIMKQELDLLDVAGNHSDYSDDDNDADDDFEENNDISCTDFEGNIQTHQLDFFQLIADQSAAEIVEIDATTINYDGNPRDNPLAKWLPVLSCNICSKRYVSLTTLRNHFRDNHIRETFYIICCNRKLYRPYQIEDHANLHNNAAAFKCDSCGKSYVSRNSLRRHTRRDHQHKAASKNAGNSQKRIQLTAVDHAKDSLKDLLAIWLPKIQCVLCPKIYSEFSKLRHHFQKQHKSEKFYITCCDRKLHSPSSIKEHMLKHKDPNAFRCKLCGTSYHHRRWLREHVERVHPEIQGDNVEDETPAPCEIQELTLRRTDESKPSIIEHSSDDERPLAEFSNKVQSHATSLQATDNALASCLDDLSDTDTNDSSGANDRAQTTHERKLDKFVSKWLPQLNCTLCSDIFTHLSLLRQHCATVHPTSNFYILCCDRKLFRPNMIKQHFLCYHDTRTFKCSICGESYSGRSDLKEHVAGKHPAAVLHKHQCGQCGKGIATARDLMRHYESVHKNVNI